MIRVAVVEDDAEVQGGIAGVHPAVYPAVRDRI